MLQAKVLKDTKGFAKRIANDRVVLKEFTRKLVKFCSANPLVVIREVLLQVQRFGKSMVAPIVESMKSVRSQLLPPNACRHRYLPEFSYDVVTYVLLAEFCSERDKLKDDGINEAAPPPSPASSLAAG